MDLLFPEVCVYIPQKQRSIYTSSNLSSDTQVAICSLMTADGLTYDEAFCYDDEF